MTREAGRKRVFDEPRDMSADQQPNGRGPWVLFPEIIGISVMALLLPLALVQVLLAGHSFLGAAGFLVWLVAVFFTMRFIRRRQYGLAYLPMGLIAGLFLIVYRLCQ